MCLAATLSLFIFYYQVREACESIDPALMVVTCGSYRRGRETCGDVDILVTHPDGRSHKGVFSRLTQILKQQGSIIFISKRKSVHYVFALPLSVAGFFFLFRLLLTCWKVPGV